MKLKENLTIHSMGDEFVVISSNPDDFKGMIKLNSSGAFIFNLLSENKTQEEILAKLEEKYDIDKKTAEKDLSELLNFFEKSGLMYNG